MRLLNTTKHSTAGLRTMFYSLAKQAHISTRGVTVEVRRGTRHLHGLCTPLRKSIIIWALNTSKTNDISFVWLHELAHITPKNRRLYAAGHAYKGQRHADSVAAKVLGVTSQELTWHSSDWRLEPTSFAYSTKAEALAALKRRRYPFGKPNEHKRYRLSAGSKRGCYRLEYKRINTLH